MGALDRFGGLLLQRLNSAIERGRNGMLVGFASVAASITVSGTVMAEAGVPDCLPVRLVEVFAGAPGCEDASYFMLELDAPVDTTPGVHYQPIYVGGPDGSSYIDLYGVLEQDAGAGMKILVGTAAVEQAFGTVPDVLVEDLPLVHHEGEIEACYFEWEYEAYAGVHMCRGDALRIEDSGWINTPPDPQNSRGQQATRWACGRTALPDLWTSDTELGPDAAAKETTASDATAPDAAVRAATSETPVATGDAGTWLCDPSVFEPPTLPPSDTSSSNSASTDTEGSTSSPRGTGAPNSAATDAGPSSMTTPGSSRNTDSSSPASSPLVDSGTVGSSNDTHNHNDAGTTPAPDASGSCSCRIGGDPGGTRAPTSLVTLMAAGVGLAVRRRRSSGRGR